jgi:hypothetical protein
MAFDAYITSLPIRFSVGTISAYQDTVSEFEQQMRLDMAQAFFPTNDFWSGPITYKHALPLNANRTYDAYFEAPSRDASPNSAVQVTQLHPFVELNLYEMAQYPDLNDVLTIKNINYEIDRWDDDGAGLITLYLVREGGKLN